MCVLRRLCLLPVALVALLAVPAFASADATIEVNGTQIEIAPAPGAGQVVDVQGISEAPTTVTFTGSGLTGVGPECSGSSTSIVCDKTLVTGITAATGTGEDNAVWAADANCASNVSLPLTVTGGTGRSIIRGGNGADDLAGGSGGDDISGCGGADDLSGGSGNDHLVGGDGADTADGGPDDDLLGMENALDQDTLTCGAGSNDAYGIDLDVDNNDAPIDVFAGGGTPAGAGCEHQVPHLRGTSTLSSAPVAGATYSASSIVPATVRGAAPNTFQARWFLCSSAVLTAADQFAPGAVANSACTPLNGGALSASITVPANAGGQYLGAVVNAGLLANAGLAVGPFFAYESWSSAVARQIQAAPGGGGGSTTPPTPPTTPTTPTTPPSTAPPSNAFTTPTRTTCRSASCKVTVTLPGGGAVTVRGPSKYVSTTTRSLGAGRSTLSIRLKSRAKRQLKRRHRLTFTVRVAFRPTGGTTRTRSIKVTYRTSR